MNDSTDMTQQLHDFVAASRWFGGKGREFSLGDLTRLGVIGDQPRLVLQLVSVDYAEGDREQYQVPLAFYREPVERLSHALVGTWSDPEFGAGHWYDATHDREAMGYLLDTFAQATPQQPVTIGALSFCRVPGHDLDTTTHSTLFSGEQSNSSLAFGEDSLFKLFRKITQGKNPDIEIHEVLTAGGSTHIAQLYGWLQLASEPDSDHDLMHLGMLQEFLRTASDGWDLACASVRNLYAEADLHADEVGGDFAGESGRLGTALADVHAVLADSFEVQQWGADQLTALAATMNRRLDDAVAIVPELAPHAPALRALYESVGALTELSVQRIHGDLHLGQTLRTVDGWKIVDFEGEPAKTLAERVLPDAAWRDVAGMIRSFDYAPRAVSMTLAGTAGSSDEGASQRAYRARQWANRNRAAFLDAYSARRSELQGGDRSSPRSTSLADSERILLTAYIADKAVYETVYETRNRPTWVPIPMAAITEIVTDEGVK